MHAADRQHQQTGLLQRSYTVFVLKPEGAISDWLSKLDGSLPGSLANGAVVLDLSAVALSKDAIANLVASLEQRRIPVLGFDGIEASALGSELRPLLRDQRHSTIVDEAEKGKPAPPGRPKRRGTDKTASKPHHLVPSSSPSSEPTTKGPNHSSSLVIQSPVRSGQSICFPEGDLTVLGAVGSGAEVLAGGSVHVYGALRGRAMAGSGGNPNARIFCQKLEAEMLAIDGYYRRADDIDEQLRGRPVQVWLDGNEIRITALN